MDQLVQTILDRDAFSEPELAEVILRPWAADRLRLRPQLRIIGHTGFLLRARRRGGWADEAAKQPTNEASADASEDPESELRGRSSKHRYQLRR